MKSKMYDKIKLYYDTGLWSEIRVRNMVINLWRKPTGLPVGVVSKGIITETEYVSIVGKEYENN